MGTQAQYIDLTISEMQAEGERPAELFVLNKAKVNAEREYGQNDEQQHRRETFRLVNRDFLPLLVKQIFLVCF